MIGKTVKWDTVNGIVKGVVEALAREGNDNYIVRLSSGKIVIANKNSFIDE